MAYGANYINYAKLSYSYYSNELLEIGIRRLYNLINYHLKIINIGHISMDNMMKVSLNGEESDLGKMIIDTLLYKTSRSIRVFKLAVIVIVDIFRAVSIYFYVNGLLSNIITNQLVYFFIYY